MSQATLAIKRISGHAGPAPGEDVERDYQVCKLIDTTTCIGCKACEVACLEWNGYSFTDTVFDNSYQTMPQTAWNYWNLIKFNEHEREDGSITLLMRKDQCMHCADPGCLAACPADGAIVQYTNGIVDFQQQNCIGCGYCVSGCPFDIPKFNPTTKKMFKCTLCVDRVSEGLEPACIKSCPTGCLHFGSKDDMVDLAETRAKQLRENYRHRESRRLRSGGRGRHGRHLCASRCDQSRGVWRIAERSSHSVGGALLERTGEVDRKSGHAGRHPRRDPALLALWSEGSACRDKDENGGQP